MAAKSCEFGVGRQNGAHLGDGRGQQFPHFGAEPGPGREDAQHAQRAQGQHGHRPRRLQALHQMGPGVVKLAGSHGPFQLGPPALGEVPREAHGGVVSHHPADRQAPGGLEGHEAAIAVGHDVAGAGLAEHGGQVGHLGGCRIVGRLVRGPGAPAPVVAVHRLVQHPAEFSGKGPVERISDQCPVHDDDAGSFAAQFLRLGRRGAGCGPPARCMRRRTDGVQLEVPLAVVGPYRPCLHSPSLFLHPVGPAAPGQNQPGTCPCANRR